MRTLPFLFLVMAGGIIAAEETFRLSPQTLAEWSIAGARPGDFSAQTNLVLPAGSQVTRAISSSNLVAALVTRPTFGATPNDCPILEIGQTALIFVRNANVGALLVMGENGPPVTVAPEIALDGEGRPVDPIKVTVDCAGNDISIVCGSQKTSVTLEGVRAPQTMIVFSTGDNSAWPIDTFEVTAFPVEVAAPAAPSPGGSRNSPSSEGTPMIPSVANTAGAALTVGQGVLADGSPEAAKAKPAAAAETMSATLEVFTPPAVRSGRVAQVRAAVAQASK